MHTCLNVDELVRLIACELVVSRAEATTVALACCHKGFEDPVLDALWETQCDLFRLLRSLPADVWNEGVCTSFKRLPTTLEWARFRKYARRIRNLEQVWPPVDRLSLEVFPVLQLRAIEEPLFPNLETLEMWVPGESIPFIPLFLSSRTTIIKIENARSSLPKPIVASMIATIPTACPNLQEITLHSLPRDPIITTAVSAMLLSSNRDALRRLRVDSPLTEEARQVVYNLPNLRGLEVVIERDSPPPAVVLPNLTELEIKYDHDHDWFRGFRGATLGKLASVTFRPECESLGGFLEAFERVALPASVQDTLSGFCLFTSCSWSPNYSSLLSFTQLTYLVIEFSCDDGCSSIVDDDIIMDIARTMPKLEILRLGDDPCGEIHTGVTAKGFMVLAHLCPDLSTLRVHFDVGSLGTPPAISAVAPNTGSTTPQMYCALTDLEVGRIPVPEGSALTVALTLVRIFPRLVDIGQFDEDWDEVVEAIRVSGAIIDYSRTTLGNAI